ncbi:MAG: CCC motif membrane protein [Capnocytophaga sp.]|nr:CCC motif membrane protein [Capnocytophaga sp.]
MEKQVLPHSTAVLVLGIASIVTCCCYGVVGLICAIIAIVLTKKAKAIYRISPESYLGYGNLQAGYVMAIIGIVLNIIYIAYFIFLVQTFGMETLSNPEELQRAIREWSGQ